MVMNFDNNTLGCTEGDVRLLEGSSELEGRVELCRNNQWGTVCVSGWDNSDARVVCRQLGFSVAGRWLITSEIYDTYMHDTHASLHGYIHCELAAWGIAVPMQYRLVVGVLPTNST